MNKQYAIAFFEIAKEDNKLEDCKLSFDVFLEVAKNEEDLMQVLKSPAIGLNEKKDLIKKSFINCELDFIYFLNVVLENGRIANIFDIYQQFLYLYNDNKNIKVVEVSSVIPLTSEEEARLLESLKKCYSGFEIVIVNKIDPRVVGGYRILVNGVSIDLSVKRKIENLEKFIIN